MKSKFLVTGLLLACTYTASLHAAAQARSQELADATGLSIADQNAYIYLRTYTRWWQAPYLYMESCAKSDPSGIKQRQTLYQDWFAKHAADHAKFVDFGDKILPRVMPILVNAKEPPLEVLAKVSKAELALNFEKVADAKKAEYCDSFATKSLPATLPWKADAFALFETLIAQSEANTSLSLPALKLRFPAGWTFNYAQGLFKGTGPASQLLTISVLQTRKDRNSDDYNPDAVAKKILEGPVTQIASNDNKVIVMPAQALRLATGKAGYVLASESQSDGVATSYIVQYVLVNSNYAYHFVFGGIGSAMTAMTGYDKIIATQRWEP